MKRIFLLAVCCFFVVGCASTKYHQAKKVTKYGYFDSQFQDNIYDVQFKANSYSRGLDAYDYTLLRSCEVCLENGYKSFDIVKQNNYTTKSSYVQSNAYGNAYYASGQAYNVVSYYPYYEFRIECFKEKNGYYDAEQIRNNLIKKHNIKKLKKKYNLK